jgi:glycosyltransferase involved in cell wall biosynthesis/Tfp pilus assembly protein PilF
MPINIADAYRYSAFAQRQTGLVFNLPAPDPAQEQLPEGVSLCMIVKNEERFLAECLESVKDIVDEINIVDTGSTDRTVEIARQYGAKIEFRDWRNDFAWARNESLKMATRRWTLVLDGDEELEVESAALVRSLRTTPAGTAAVYINIVNTIDDSAGAGTMSHRLIRIFPTTPLLRYGGVIHEAVGRADGGEFVGVLSPIKILHKGYTVELLKAKEKDARNRPLLAKAYEENREDLFSMFNFGNSEILAGNTQAGIEILERMLAQATTPKLYFPIAYLMLAQTYCETLGEFDKSLEIIDRANDKFPNDAGIVFTKGQSLAKMKRNDEARAIYEGALDMREVMVHSVMTDEEIFEWKIYYAMAGTYEREENWTRAIEFIDKALANKPNSFLMQRTKATFLEFAERFFEAEQAFRSLPEVEPQRGKIELVNYLLRRRRYAQVLALVEDEIDIGLDAETIAQLNLTAAKAVIEAQSGDPLPFLESALRHAPGNGPALRLMENVLLERGDAAALARFHAAELLAPCKTAEDFARRSFRLLALERNDDARLVAEQGLGLDPHNPELRFNSALASFRLGDELRASGDFGRVEPRVPEVFAKAMQLRAGLLLKHGDRNAAVVAIEQGLAAMPPSADAVLRSARALIHSGARAPGRAVLETYVGVDRSIALELAAVMLQDGDVDGAGRVAAASLT